MRHALLDADRVITNIIEVEPDIAPDFDAHYLGDHPLGIGEQYPEVDLQPEPAPIEWTQEDINAALAVDHEYRITLLELGVNDNAV